MTPSTLTDPLELADAARRTGGGFGRELAVGTRRASSTSGRGARALRVTPAAGDGAPAVRAAKTSSAKAKAKAKGKAKAKAKKLPVCTKKDLKKKKSKRRKCRVVKPKAKTTNPALTAPATTTRPSPTGPVAGPPVTAPTPDAWTQPEPGTVPERTDGLRTYQGAFGREQATRLLFRAGYGPTPGQADEFAALGLEAAVAKLMNAGTARLEGPAPSGDFLVAGGFAPNDRWGHAHLEWLDRMARSTDQLGERMTLVLHDWLAISASDVGDRALRTSVGLLRKGWRGSFRQLMLDLTIDPAMLQWLNGLGSDKWSPNENYARELMELFCLGADRGAYTEADIRELARALTGWVADWSEAQGLHNFRWDRSRWDAKDKTFFAGKPYARTGKFDWKDTVNAVIDHPQHASYVALKLWGAFIPTPPTPVTLAELEALYRASGERLEPLVQAILLHPDLHTGPSVTKSPATYVAGLLRARRRGIDDESWTWICSTAGQLLGYPPNVSGWNEKAWLNTTTFQARWWAVSNHLNKDGIDEDDYRGSAETPAQAVDAALAYWGNPAITPAHRAMLDAHAANSAKTSYWAPHVRLAMRQRALRMLVAAAPDHQVS